MAAPSPQVIFQCPACRALVAGSSASLDVENRRAGLGCPACGAVTWLAAAEGAAAVVDLGPAAPPAALPPSLLPTLVGGGGIAAPFPHPQGGKSSDSFSPEQRHSIGDKLAKLTPTTDAQTSLAQIFTGLLDRWGAEAEHKQFLKKAAMVGELAFAGQHYRLLLDVIPGDAQAKKAQNEILTLAMAAMSQQKDIGSVDSAANTSKLVAAVFVVVALLAAAAAIWFVPSLLRPSGDGATMNDAPQP